MRSSSPACRQTLLHTTAEWTTRIGSKGRLIFVFSVVLELEEDLEFHDYPREEIASSTANLRKRLADTKVARWNVFVVTVDVSPATHIR